MLTQFLGSRDLPCVVAVTGIFFNVFQGNFPHLFSLLLQALTPIRVLTQVGLPPLGDDYLPLFFMFYFCYKNLIPSSFPQHLLPYNTIWYPMLFWFHMLFPQLIFCVEFIDLPKSLSFTGGVRCGVIFCSGLLLFLPELRIPLV